MDIRENIRQFILENFLFTDDASALNDGDSLLEQGIIDSTGALELAQHLEGTFRFEVLDDEMLPENLDSVENLITFVVRKQAQLTHSGALS